MIMEIKYYTCIGGVRGRCGMHHKTLEAAARHCEKDGRDAIRWNGPKAYSDRQVYAVTVDGQRISMAALEYYDRINEEETP
jgi:hypothetical protein